MTPLYSTELTEKGQFNTKETSCLKLDPQKVCSELSLFENGTR